MIRYWARLVSWYSSTSTWRQRPRYQASTSGTSDEQTDREQEQIVEVHAPRRAQALLVAPVHGGQALLARSARRLLEILGGQHLVLGGADPMHDRGRRERAIVETLRPHALLDQRLPIVLVVYREVRWVAEVTQVLTQHPHAGGVEGGTPAAARRPAGASRASTRRAISPAALLVKVTAST